jgi:very-short-patch-repair endonuclease
MPDARDVRHHMDAQRRTHRVDAALAALAGRQYGVVSRAQLTELGIGRGAIGRRLEAGRLHPIHRGVYAVGHRALRREGAWMAAVLVADGAVLSHRSAAALWGIWPGEQARVDVTARQALRLRPRLRFHRARLPPDEVTTHRGIRVTTPTRTLLDLAAVVRYHHLARAATEAEIQRLGSPTSLPDLVARYPRRPGSPAIQQLLAQREIGRNVTKRELELRFLAFVDEHALPRPRINARVEDMEVDCLWPHRRLIAELDGFATHGTRAAFENDRSRDRRLQLAGYRVIRITWRQLEHDRTSLARQVRALLTPAQHG